MNEADFLELLLPWRPFVHFQCIFLLLRTWLLHKIYWLSTQIFIYIWNLCLFRRVWLYKERNQDLKSIKIVVKRNLSTMATTSDNVDYSFSNDEKLNIHNQNSENIIEENKAGPSSETNRASAEPDNRDQLHRSADLSISKECVNEAITKLETILNDLKNQRDTLPEDKRIIQDASKKRSRNTKKYTSSPRSDSSSDSSRTRRDQSPSPKRTRKESPRKKYDSDSSSIKEGRHTFRERSLSSSSSDRSYSCVSNKLKKELSSFLGNSFVSVNRNKHTRKSRRDRSISPRRSQKRESYGRSRYSRKDYSRDRSESRRDDSYDRYSKRKSTRRNSDKYSNYNRNYQVKSNDIEERYSRYYAVMYAFSIIMDILRQDDIYSTY